MSASGDRVTLRTTAGPEAMAALERAGGTVIATGRDTLTITGLPAARVVSVLGTDGVPFSEVAAHRATLEEAYMELTKDAVQYRAQGPAGDTDGPPGDAGRPPGGAAGSAGEAAGWADSEVAR
jgi:ABC-2 type transport system ATP-binding protein